VDNEKFDIAITEIILTIGNDFPYNVRVPKPKARRRHSQAADSLPVMLL